MTRVDPPDSRALVALTELVRTSIKTPPATALQRGENAVLSRLAQHRAQPRARSRRLVLAAAFASLGAVGACVAVFWGFWGQEASAPQPVVVSKIEGGRLLEGGYLAESGNAGVKLEFNEGSQFTLKPGARGRLRSASAEGAQFAIERGAASFRIVPSAKRRWSVEAGPFLVQVTGTEFTVDWDPTSEQLDVMLRRGRVVVSGPIVGSELGLRPGQHLSVSLPKAETIITEPRSQQPRHDAGPPSPTPELAAPELQAPGESAAPSEDAPAPAPSSPSEATPSTPRSERSWKEAMANGQWDRILADVDRDGLAATVAKVSSDDLFALTDAARYRRRPEVARAALLAHRRRFPQSPRSVHALFLLGRVEELRAGDATRAIQWYDDYLARAPAGTYSAEALGRKMILWNDLHGAASTRRIAEQYLRRFPQGSYAGTARALLGAP